jgi:hypothetical protein
LVCSTNGEGNWMYMEGMVMAMASWLAFMISFATVAFHPKKMHSWTIEIVGHLKKMEDMEWTWQFRWNLVVLLKRSWTWRVFVSTPSNVKVPKMTHAIGISFGLYTGNLKFIENQDTIQKKTRACIQYYKLYFFKSSVTIAGAPYGKLGFLRSRNPYPKNATYSFHRFPK